MFKPWDRIHRVHVCYGGGGGSTTYTYPPYLESVHKSLVNHSGDDLARYSVIGAMNLAFDESPYSSYQPLDVAGAMLGGLAISAFPSLYDMFGKFMAGLDIEVLWSQLYEETVNGPEVQNCITSQAAMLDDDIMTNIMPRISAGMRDINSVMSSAFPMAKAIIADSRLKGLNKFAADLRFKMIDITQDRWIKHLNWNQAVIEMYGQYGKLYFSAQMDADTVRMDFATKDKLWNIKLFESARAMLGALQGAPTSGGLNEPSQIQKSVSGSMSGAAAGAMIGAQMGSGGGLPGAVVGGALGLAASFF